jgi:hypothetical protein
VNLIHHKQQTLDFTGKNYFWVTGGTGGGIAQNCAGRTIVAKCPQVLTLEINGIAIRKREPTIIG